MVSFSRSLGAVFALGIAGGAIILMTLPPGSDSFRPVAYVPSTPAVPCKKQTWPMSDRQCQPWTSRGKSEERRETVAQAPDVGAAERAPEAAKPSLAVEAGVKPPIGPRPQAEAEIVTEPAPPPVARIAAAAVVEPKPAAAHSPAPLRRADPNRRKIADRTSGIPVSAIGRDGSRRTIVIRPTSPQDVYYYAARREGGSALSYAR